MGAVEEQLFDGYSHGFAERPAALASEGFRARLSAPGGVQASQKVRVPEEADGVLGHQEPLAGV